MRIALGLMSRVASTDLPVLIQGETGTGKELFARALHAESPRAKAPFVPVNCASIPATLFESEVFGHVKGAFTGADRNHPGLVREAEGGTLFLDEIGELALDLQPKLLRMLQERRMRPVGSGQDVDIDVRIVAATNRDLRTRTLEGAFREDLYFRLAVIEIRVPPLRERLEDLPILVRSLLARTDRPDAKVSSRAMERLVAYAWPGNVRELENELRRAVVFAGGGLIDERHLSDKLRTRARRSVVATAPLAAQRAALERAAIVEALRACDGNRSLAAMQLGLSRQALHSKLRAYGITEAEAPPPRQGRRG
jgi:DNA-binding NtrC family response regulator